MDTDLTENMISKLHIHEDTIENYKSTFGDDYFSFWFGGVHFIVLNSQLYEDYSLVEDHKVAQDKWLGMIVNNDCKNRI